jgi:hypothetical protein
MLDKVQSILSATVEPYDAERLRLRLGMRFTNQGKFAVAITGAWFRLLVDSVPRAPENFLDEFVDGHAAKEGELVFVFPRSTRSLALKVIDGDQEALLPLHLKP